jgi:peptidoglycan/LPS O-acetylase OafA/YrhL
MGRIPSLDGLRAIAVSLVIACHFGNDYELPYFNNLGDLGVRMFFVISGFLITGLLLKELDRTGEISLSWFYFRRTLRIFPAFYFYMGVMLVLSASSLNHLTLLGALPALTYTSNYWSEWDAAGYVTSHTWSLATEEQFYLIWPFTLALAGRSRAVWILVAAVVASPILRTMIYLHNGGPSSSLSAFHVNMDHIGMGCLLAFLRERLHNTYWYRRILNSCAFILVPIFIVLATYQQNHPSIHRTVLFFLIAASIALSIDWAITHHKSAVGRALNCRLITFIGAISYSLYLWQQPFTHLNGEKPNLMLSGPWQILANPVVGLFCIFACACASYYLIEQPALRLRERIENGGLISLRSNDIAQEYGK